MLPWHRRPKDSARSRHDPRDYQSRAARLRIFVMVAALMTVLVAMNEARKPHNWAWIWQGANRDPSQDPIDSRIPPAAALSTQHPGTLTPEKSSIKPTDSVQDLSQRAWSRVWGTLNYREKDQLSRLLRVARRGGHSTAEDIQFFEPLRTTLDVKWNDYLRDQNRHALLPEPELPAERRRAVLQSLTELEMTWNRRWKPAFDAAAAPRDWTAEERADLLGLEEMLYSIALTLVRDDMVWRPDDGAAWFRLFEQLQDQDPAQLARQSVKQVGFVQIFRQSAEYRGKVVTIRGTARMVYRVPAPANYLGIQEYFLFWVQPEDGSNRPIVVYALYPPPNFPAITLEQQKVQEEVEVTGYFFKRWAYRAADGLNSAPLVIARSPQWFSRTEATQTQLLTATHNPTFWLMAIGGLAGMLLLAMVLVWLLNWSNRPSPVIADIRAAAETAANEAANWKSMPATPSIDEGLRNLEQTHHKEGAE